MNRRSREPSPIRHGGACSGSSAVATEGLVNAWVRPLMINLGYAAVLMMVSLTSSPPPVPIFSQRDWLAHGLAYGVQVLLLHEFFRRIAGPGSAIVAAATIGLVFGTAVEALQLLQPARFYETSDLVANGVGVAGAVALLTIVRAQQARQKTEQPL